MKATLFMPLFSFMVLSCSLFKTDEDKTYTQFHVSFTNGWLDSEDHGIIFISDMDGNFLGGSVWEGDDSFDLVPENGGSFPSDVMVTTLKRQGNYVYLTTNLSVTPDDWTWKGYPSSPETGGNVTINLTNFDNASIRQGIVSDLWNYDYLYSVNNPIYFITSQLNSDIYLSFNYYDGYCGYTWINGANPGQGSSVDLQNLQATQSLPLALPQGIGYASIYLSGYLVNGDHYHGGFLLDRFRSYELDNADIVLHYPEGFSDYRTSMYLRDDGGNGAWYQATYGELNTSVSKLDGFIGIDNSDPGDIQLTTAGSYDQIRTYWIYSEDTTHYTWNVYGPSDLTAYSLPVLPELVTNGYPGLNRDNFILYTSEILDVNDLDNYDEIISLLFKSDSYFYDVSSGVKTRISFNAGYQSRSFPGPEYNDPCDIFYNQ